MASFIGEVNAFKPGNVSVCSEGHGMTVKDFTTSAEVSVPLLCRPGAGVGRRVLDSVVATRSAVNCNTNLGMLLLFAPVIAATEAGFKNKVELREALALRLKDLTEQDTVDIYTAIRLADPGGLGRVDAHDVRQEPDCSLREAMTAAASRDLVALQYCNDFKQIFDDGLTNITCFTKRHNNVEWATVSCYLMFLSSFRDSHIERRYGREAAEELMQKAGLVFKHYASDPGSDRAFLRDFDKTLKEKRYNPGTIADLTAASLLVYNLAKQREPGK